MRMKFSEIMIQVVLLPPKSSEDHKKKGLHRNLALYSAGTGGIYSC